MTLNEYIQIHRTKPNPAIAKSYGADAALVAYLRETPGNTNVNVTKGMAAESESGGRRVIIYEGYAPLTHVEESGYSYTQIISPAFTTPSVFLNVKEGTTFEIEIDGIVYNFTIETVNKAVLAGAFSSALELPFFQVEYQNNQCSLAIMVEEDFDEQAAYIKITQTSDYEVESELEPEPVPAPSPTPGTGEK